MSDTRGSTVRWTGRGLAFEGTAQSAPPIVLDGNSREGPSPTEALLMSVAACMGIDIQVILEKGRVPLRELVIEIEGDRAADPPRRFTTLRMTVRAEGPAEEDRPKLDRAVELSKEKYCSVFHTLRPDLEVRISTEIV